MVIMIKFENKNYFSTVELRKLNLYWKLSKFYNPEPSYVYFNSIVRLSNLSEYKNINNGFVKLKGFFNISLNEVSYDDRFLLLHFTDKSYVNNIQVKDIEPIKITPREILFNFINYPDLYFSLFRCVRTNNIGYFYNLLPSYFTKLDVIQYCQKTFSTENNYDELLKKVTLFTLNEENKDKYSDWYLSISDKSEHCYTKRLGNDLFVTIELLKKHLGKLDFMKTIYMLEDMLHFHYIYINTNKKSFNFYVQENEFNEIVESSFDIRGFLAINLNTTSQDTVWFRTTGEAFINEQIPNSSLEFATKSFENLLPFIDVKNNCLKIEATYAKLKNSFIKKSPLFTQDVTIYYRISDIKMWADMLEIDFNENELLKLATNNTKTKINQMPQEIISKKRSYDINNIQTLISQLEGQTRVNPKTLYFSIKAYKEEGNNTIPDFDTLYTFLPEYESDIPTIYEVTGDGIILSNTLGKTLEKRLLKRAYNYQLNKLTKNLVTTTIPLYH